MTAELKIDVLNQFHNLTLALEDLHHPLCELDNDLPIWFSPSKHLEAFYTNATSSREQAFTALSQLEYLDIQEPREILVSPGILAASPKTLEAVDVVNAAKQSFKAAMLALKNAQISLKKDPWLNEQFESTLKERSKTVGSALRKLGLGRVHLKQCYRTIPTFHERPLKVAWTWANTRAIKRISVEQAIQLLHRQRKDPGLQLQLAKLRTLSFSEPLAIVQDLAPHLRANITLADPIEETRRVMIKGPVPIFYLHEPGTELPETNILKEKSSKNNKRPTRKDAKLDPEPFLPTIRVHRYLRV